jgi:hypothetical protein
MKTAVECLRMLAFATLVGIALTQILHAAVG